MAGVQLRPARLEETAALTNLVMRSKAQWGYDAAFMERCRAELTVTERHIRSAFCRVAEAAGQPIGFIAAGIEGPTIAEISLLFVAPEAMGRGVGLALVDAASTHFQALGIEALVTAADPHALAFYHRAGFVTAGEEPSDSIPGRVLPIVRRELAP
jgi:ribosomal protein S18 acetylase RimI-like enzyme